MICNRNIALIIFRDSLSFLSWAQRWPKGILFGSYIKLQAKTDSSIERLHLKMNYHQHFIIHVKKKRKSGGWKRSTSRATIALPPKDFVTKNDQFKAYKLSAFRHLGQLFYPAAIVGTFIRCEHEVVLTQSEITLQAPLPPMDSTLSLSASLIGKFICFSAKLSCHPLLWGSLSDAPFLGPPTIAN